MCRTNNPTRNWHPEFLQDLASGVLGVWVCAAGSLLYISAFSEPPSLGSLICSSLQKHQLRIERLLLCMWVSQCAAPKKGLPIQHSFRFAITPAWGPRAFFKDKPNFLSVISVTFYSSFWRVHSVDCPRALRVHIVVSAGWVRWPS
jgi:hypothetical protein